MKTQNEINYEIVQTYFRNLTNRNSLISMFKSLGKEWSRFIGECLIDYPEIKQLVDNQTGTDDIKYEDHVIKFVFDELGVDVMGLYTDPDYIKAIDKTRFMTGLHKATNEYFEKIQNIKEKLIKIKHFTIIDYDFGIGIKLIDFLYDKGFHKNSSGFSDWIEFCEQHVRGFIKIEFDLIFLDSKNKWVSNDYINGMFGL